MQVVRVDMCLYCRFITTVPDIKHWETIWAVAEHDLVIELRELLFMLPFLFDISLLLFCFGLVGNHIHAVQ